jgi:ATP-dependent DNA helicase PIF1
MRSTLNDEQCRVVESVLSGHSTFFSGPAGSGKSHVLSTLLNANEHGVGGRDGRPRKIVVTATTGVAACNVGGITIHSFAGIGTGSGSLSDLAKKVMANEYTKGRWREVDVLVIDEISMLSSTFLDKLSFIASRARNDRRPFGGVQLVVCGDFYQLPPIDLRTDGFAFESKCWSEVIRCSVLLTQVFRQRGDATLMNILDEARIGELSTESAEVLRRHATLPSTAFRGSSRNDVEKIIPTLLECRNREVDKANEVEMAKLPGEVYTFQSRDKSVNEAMKAQLKHCQGKCLHSLATQSIVSFD